MMNSRFAMVSEWMINGNINEFIKLHAEADRFELVGTYLVSAADLNPLMIDDRLVTTASRCCARIDIYARRGHDPWRSKGCRPSSIKSLFCLLTHSFQGQYFDQPGWSGLLSRLRTHYHSLRSCVLHNLKFVCKCWHKKMDEPRAT